MPELDNELLMLSKKETAQLKTHAKSNTELSSEKTQG